MAYRTRPNKLRSPVAFAAVNGSLSEPHSPHGTDRRPGLAELPIAPGTPPGAHPDHRGERVPEHVRRRYLTNGAAA